LGDDPQSVVLEISEPVSAALDELHFAEEAFGDAIVAGGSPPACDFRSELRVGILAKSAIFLLYGRYFIF
jgi:hypothetical protein